MLKDFGSLRVVFGILLKDGRDIAVNSLFAFAQVSLLQAVRRLRAMNAEVEVIAIRR
ncbi:TIGR04141 family sporadically distributed protein [Streptomyces sp. NPDC096323]